jgi:hypothetical protein
MDMGSRDMRLDESLGLNCAWYADILLTLTASPAQRSASPPAAWALPQAGALAHSEMAAASLP